MKLKSSLIATAIALCTTTAFADNTTVLKNLETTFDGQIGVYAIDTNNNQIIAYRADQPFPMQSTMKFMVATALFKQSEHQPGLLQKNLTYTQKDLTSWSPVTAQHLKTGMTLQALAEAATTYSDNTAANLLIKYLGGPEAITAFAHSIGNTSFNAKHYEGNLNSNPKNTDDTVTPHDMAISLQKVLLGNVLSTNDRNELTAWMHNNTTSYQRMRAGTPPGWNVADKTGTGDYGVNNDIGILWSPACKPIVLAIYTAQNQKNATTRDDIVASTTRIVMSEFAKEDACF